MAAKMIIKDAGMQLRDAVTQVPLNTTRYAVAIINPDLCLSHCFFPVLQATSLQSIFFIRGMCGTPASIQGLKFRH